GKIIREGYRDCGIKRKIRHRYCIIKRGNEIHETNTKFDSEQLAENSRAEIYRFWYIGTRHSLTGWSEQQNIREHKTIGRFYIEDVYMYVSSCILFLRMTDLFMYKSVLL